jgi:hypothetical protein
MRHLREVLPSVASPLRQRPYPVTFRLRQCGGDLMLTPDEVTAMVGLHERGRARGRLRPSWGAAGTRCGGISRWVAGWPTASRGGPVGSTDSAAGWRSASAGTAAMPTSRKIGEPAGTIKRHHRRRVRLTLPLPGAASVSAIVATQEHLGGFAWISRSPSPCWGCFSLTWWRASLPLPMKERRQSRRVGSHRGTAVSPRLKVDDRTAPSPPV